jgi:hypothetical protein
MGCYGSYSNGSESLWLAYSEWTKFKLHFEPSILVTAITG